VQGTPSVFLLAWGILTQLERTVFDGTCKCLSFKALKRLNNFMENDQPFIRDFLGRLGLRLADFPVSRKNNSATCGIGWDGIEIINCYDANKDYCQVDIRHATSAAIFKQNLVDFGLESWRTPFALEPKQCRWKLFIVYLCDSSVNLESTLRTDCIPSHLLTGFCWNEVWHFYF
jgi:hypothetical protein